MNNLRLVGIHRLEGHAYASKGQYIYRPIFFPAWRSKLAAFGRRAQSYRCAAEVENKFSRLLPRTLLTPAERGADSRRRIFTWLTPLVAFIAKREPVCRSLLQQGNRFRLREPPPAQKSSSRNRLDNLFCPFQLIFCVFDALVFDDSRGQNISIQCVIQN